MEAAAGYEKVNTYSISRGVCCAGCQCNRRSLGRGALHLPNQALCSLSIDIEEAKAICGEKFCLEIFGHLEPLNHSNVSTSLADPREV